MSIPNLKETIEESEIFCDYCGKLLGFIKWFEDLTTSCPTCNEKPTPQEAAGTHKMLCSDCRAFDT